MPASKDQSPRIAKNVFWQVPVPFKMMTMSTSRIPFKMMTPFFQEVALTPLPRTWSQTLELLFKRFGTNSTCPNYIILRPDYGTPSLYSPARDPNPNYIRPFLKKRKNRSPKRKNRSPTDSSGGGRDSAEESLSCTNESIFSSNNKIQQRELLHVVKPKLSNNNLHLRQSASIIQNIIMPTTKIKQRRPLLLGTTAYHPYDLEITRLYLEKLKKQGGEKRTEELLRQGGEERSCLRPRQQVSEERSCLVLNRGSRVGGSEMARKNELLPQQVKNILRTRIAREHANVEQQEGGGGEKKRRTMMTPDFAKKLLDYFFATDNFVVN